MFAKNPGHDRWHVMLVAVLAIGLLLATTMLVHGLGFAAATFSGAIAPHEAEEGRQDENYYLAERTIDRKVEIQGEPGGASH